MLTSDFRSTRAAPLMLMGCLMILLLSVSAAQAAVKTWTGATSNDWAVAGNWDAGAPSGAGDDAIIPATINSPAIQTAITIGSLEVKLGATLHINGNAGTLTVTNSSGRSGNINNAGTINVGATSAPGAAPTLAGGNTVTCTGALLNTGVINLGDNSATDTHVGLLGTSTAPLGSLNNVGPSGAPVTGTGTIRVSTNTGGDNAIYVSGDWYSAGTFIVGDATVTLSNTGILEHTSIDGFGALTVSKGTRTLAADLDVNGALTVSTPAVLNVGSYDIDVSGLTTVNGRMTATGGTQTLAALTIVSTGVYDNGTNNVTVNASGALTNGGIVILGSGSVSVLSIDNNAQLTSTSGNLSVTTDFDDTTGIFNANGGTITFTDTGTFKPVATTRYNNITKTGLGTTTDLDVALTMVGALTVQSGTFDADDFDITVGGDVIVAGILDMGTGDLILNPLAGATQSFDPGLPNSLYENVTKQGDGITNLINHELVLDVSTADLLIDAGTFAMGDQDVTLPDTLIVSDTATLTDNTGELRVTGVTTLNGSFNTTGAATHRFTGAVGVTVDGFYNNGTNPVTVYMASTLTNSGNVALGSGGVEINGVTNNNILTSTSGTLSVVGAAFTNAAGAVYNHNGGTLLFGGTAAFTPGLSTYNNITKTGANTTTTLAANANLNAVGVLSVESGTFTIHTDGNSTITVGSVVIGPDALLDTVASSNVLRVAGSFTNNANIVGFDAGSAPLFLTGTGTFSPGPAGAVYDGNLFTSGIVTLAPGATFHFAGTVWTNTGTFTAGAGSTVDFAAEGKQTLTTGGAPNVPAMTFANITTNNTSRTVTFATQINLNETFTIAGDVTVKDVTPGSVYNFADTAEMNVSGTWSLTGSPASHIQLLGPGAGVSGSPRWTLQLNTSGTVNINYVDLRDSELITHGGSMNGKNVGYTVVSLGNLSPSWGPFDPVPVQQPGQQPSEPSDVTLALSGTSQAGVGDTVSVQVVLTSEKAVNGVSAYLSYDPAVLSVVDASADAGIQPFTKGDFIGGLPFENSAADGVLRYTEGNVLGNATGSGTVATVSFKVLSEPAGKSTSIGFLNDASKGLVTSVSVDGSTVVPALQGLTLEIGNVSLPGDANKDGVVNLADFSILASVFGTSNTSADFNNDGFVNLGDFSILAANFGKTSADVLTAPATIADVGLVALRVPQKLHRGDLVEVAVTAQDTSLKAVSFQLGYDSSLLALEGAVQEGDFLSDALFVSQGNRVFIASRSGASQGSGVLAKLQFRVVADAASAKAISLRDVQLVDGADRFSVLPEISTALRTVPRDSRLLANYPNPFNPETWIPFELADDADVRLDIFDISGRVVRTLDLGYRPAGHYTQRSAAAYWDGMNSTGEHVASGTYFYRIHAGDFTAMRRMVILK